MKKCKRNYWESRFEKKNVLLEKNKIMSNCGDKEKNNQQ